MGSITEDRHNSTTRNSEGVGVKTALSVIIPTFNGREKLLLLLESLKNQTVDKFEVIVVDDGSTDGTGEAVNAMIQAYPMRLTYHYLDNAEIFGAGMARNHGAKLARSNVLLFLDQDCVADKNLIVKHLLYHRTKDIVLGYYAGYGDDTRHYDFDKLAEYIAGNKTIPAMKEFRDPAFHALTGPEAWKYFVSAHFSVKRNVFLDELFDESFKQWGCEDIELGYRLHKKGREISLARDCVVYNSSQDPWRTKAKFKSLMASLEQMYSKHPGGDMKRYCLERFYYMPVRYRDSAFLSIVDDTFTFKDSDTQVEIDERMCAHIKCGKDFSVSTENLKLLPLLARSVKFDIQIISSLNTEELDAFRATFHAFIRFLRDAKVGINLDEIRKQSFLLNIRLVGPEQIALGYYNKCNVKCNFCSIYTPLMSKLKHIPYSLDVPVIERTLDQAYEMGVQSIRLLSDGEPLLSPHIYGILDDIAQKGFDLNLLTNGTVINDKHMESFSRFRHLSFLINFSAGTEETYQTIYGGNPKNFELVQKNIAALNRLKRDKKKRGEFIGVDTTYIITNQNYQEIADYVVRVKKLGVDFIYFKFAILYEEGESLLLSPDQMKEAKEVISKAADRARKLSLNSNLEEILANMEDKGFKKNSDIKQHSTNLPSLNCYNGWFFANINSQGNYFICCRETDNFGNANENDFKGIFFSQAVRDILDEGASGIDMRKRMWSKCNYCYHLDTNTKAHQWLKDAKKS